MGGDGFSGKLNVYGVFYWGLDLGALLENGPPEYLSSDG